MSTWWERIKDPECKLCKLHETTKRVCSVTGRGPINARVLFVGEAPGEAEEARGLPFLGPSGRLLLELLQEAEFNAKYAITNAVCCRPPANKTPTVAQWRACSQRFLHRVIPKQNPTLIICLGLTALKAVLNDSGLSLRKARRRIFYVEKQVRGKGRAKNTVKRLRKIPVVCTYHPAAILRDPTKRQVVLEDIRQFNRILSGEKLDEDPSDRIYKYQGDDEDLPWNFSAGNALACDLETTGKKPFASDARILVCGVSQAPLHAHAFHVGDNLPTARLREALLLRSTTKVGHNIKFDLLWLKKYGFQVNGKVFDTMVAFHLLDENYPVKNLAHLARLFTPMGDYAGDIKENRTKAGYMEKLDDETLLEYVCGDADATYRLYLLFANRLRREKLQRAFHLSMRTLRTLVDVEYNGAYVDVDALDIELDRYEKLARQVRRWLKRRYPELNPKSPKQVAHLVYRDFKIRTGRYTKNRTPSADEAALRSAHDRAKTAEQQKVIRAVLRLRQLEKYLGTYVRPLREKHIQPDGLVHPEYNMIGSVSRLSCNNPNFQNIPMPFRRVFSSRFGDDGCIVQADFSQMELRVLAHYTQEPRLMEAFEHGRDVHLETASEVFGKHPSEITKQERYLAKTINFLIIYGGKAPRLAAEAGIPLPQAEDYIQRYLHRLPKVTRWIHRVRREVLRTGQVRSLFGRIRRLPVDDPESEVGARMLRQAVNFPIQDSARSITELCMADIHTLLRCGMTSVIIGTVHDSIIFDCTNDEVDEVMMMTEEICACPNTKPYGFELSVPLKVDISFGPNWKDQKELSNE